MSKIGVGVYALRDHLDKLPKQMTPKTKQEKQESMHRQIQGILLELGNMNGYETYTPDRNGLFEQKLLGKIASIDKVPPFTFSDVIDQVKFIDVIWFNERSIPIRVFEVEHTTDIQTVLLKYDLLQDFNTRFFIVAPSEREEKYRSKINLNIYKPIKDRCAFISYDKIFKIYNSTLEYNKITKDVF